MLAPCASPSPCGKESAWIDTNSAAPALRAMCTRSASGTNVSSLRGSSGPGICRFSPCGRAPSGQNRGRYPFPPRHPAPWCRYRCRHGRDRARPGPRIACLRERRCRGKSARASAIVGHDAAQKAFAIRRRKIEHEPRRSALGCIDDEGLFDPRRLGEIENQARTALHHQPEAKCLDQAAPAFARFRRKLKTTCGISMTTR